MTPRKTTIAIDGKVLDSVKTQKKRSRSEDTGYESTATISQDAVAPLDGQPSSKRLQSQALTPMPENRATKAEAGVVTLVGAGISNTLRGVESTKPSSGDVLKAIVLELTSIPTGEIAFGAELANLPPPGVRVDGLEGVGPVNFSLTDVEFTAVRQHARALRIQHIGTEWMGLKRDPTWLIPAEHLKIENPEWEENLLNLIETVGEYLGFGEAKLTARLSGLHIWERNSLWRNFNRFV
jgi:hypothetical protein